MHEQRVGIIASLAVHAACLSLLLFLPAANLKPIKTFQISFEQQESFSPAGALVADPANVPQGKGMRNEIRKETAPRIPPESLGSHEAKAPAAERPPRLSVATVAQATTPSQDRRPGAAASGTATAKTEGNRAGTVKLPSGPTGAAEVVETSFGEADAPRFIHRELPVYPRLARRMEKEGQVVLRLFIDRSGKVFNIEVIEPGAYGFTEAALAAIKKSSFAPARRRGSNIAARAILSVRFNLER